jgi:hypothetical protein
MWRLGHVSAPLDYVPRERCSWKHRFDDPLREFRTLYCAEEAITCIREVVGDLRPNAKARAEFAAWQLEQGTAPDDLILPSQEVSAEWRELHALARGKIERSGPIVDVDRPAVRVELENRHAALLTAHGMSFLNIPEVRSRNRVVTQTIARDLYDRGAAGVRFRSAHDDRPCVALKEGRALLVPLGRPRPLTEDIPELRQVCAEYGLILRETFEISYGDGRGQ